MIEKRIFYLWCGSEKPVDVVSNSSPRVRLVLRLYFLRAYNKKALLLARLFEQQLAERQRFELWEDSHPRRFSRPLH